MTQVRVRFAPSPTGPLHIGGVRTALFNYLFAKKHNGTFYLRIEDTDQTRFVEGTEKYIFDTLEWLGIPPDETIDKNEKFPPYRQSDRKHLYKKYAEQLIENGNAYYAFDKEQKLGELRKDAESKGETFTYNYKIRQEMETSLKLSPSEVQQRIQNNQPYVIRFKIPENKTLIINDIIRGEIAFETNFLDDKILFKSDGMPTYHLANVVDDHLQETSHVIRGEEWLPSLPLHFLLYESFGWKTPEFAHLPLILKPKGNGKLSKRDGEKLGFAVFPLQWRNPESGAISSGYRENGFFPEAVINFLALLGWNDNSDKEIYSLDELIEGFDLSKVSKSGARFDPVKNNWFNHQYLIRQSDKKLAETYIPILENKGINTDLRYVEKVVSLIKERASFVTDFWNLSDFFFVPPAQYDEKARKNWNEQTSELMKNIISILEKIDDFSANTIEVTIKKWIETNQIGIGKVMQPLRISLVGALRGPDLFEIISTIGKQQTLQRIKNARQML